MQRSKTPQALKSGLNPKPREVNFSQLPLDIKKHFLQLLRKNKIEFECPKHSRFWKTQVKLVATDDTEKKRIKQKLGTLALKDRQQSDFHKDCVPDVTKRTDPGFLARERAKSTQMKRMNPEYQKMRVELRAAPNVRIKKNKFQRHLKKRNQMKPNEVLCYTQEEQEMYYWKYESNDDSLHEEVFYENDYMDRDYFYANLARRLGYSQVEKNNLFDNSYIDKNREDIHKKDMFDQFEQDIREIGNYYKNKKREQVSGSGKYELKQKDTKVNPTSPTKTAVTLDSQNQREIVAKSGKPVMRQPRWKKKENGQSSGKENQKKAKERSVTPSKQSKTKKKPLKPQQQSQDSSQNQMTSKKSFPMENQEIVRRSKQQNNNPAHNELMQSDRKQESHISNLSSIVDEDDAVNNQDDTFQKLNQVFKEKEEKGVIDAEDKEVDLISSDEAREQRILHELKKAKQEIQDQKKVGNDINKHIPGTPEYEQEQERLRLEKIKLKEQQDNQIAKLNNGLEVSPDDLTDQKAKKSTKSKTPNKKKKDRRASAKKIDWEGMINSGIVQEEKNIDYGIPGNRMEERIKQREERKRKRQAARLEREQQVIYEQKKLKYTNGISRLKMPTYQKDMNANIDNLHTDELMGYYRDVIKKSNRDYADYQLTN